ncbi:aminotransferase class III-fold pyridoxal phosphate-dependent enzyme [Aeromicrobium camelliae]|nr:aminotransferase class III-fold pyridoxal phosphate-dependent enzyme [Aeromicrobium camelliae]
MTGVQDYEGHPLAERARAVMPRGNTRTTLFVPPTPPYAVSGSGPYVLDQRGHRVIDCNNNYTALIHGHAFAPVEKAVAEQLPHGTAFGLPTETEVQLAELLASRTGLPMWRFSNSGTEAVMTAVRAARAATGRELLVRFEGSYHGTSDAVVAANAPGVPEAVAGTSLALPQGDAEALREVMRTRGDEVAAVLIDIMPNRAGLVPAAAEFVTLVRELTRQHGALMIVDEVITFRIAEGGLHREYGIEPDLMTVGKVIGGGFPVGGLGGTAEVMAIFDPLRELGVSWGGTFSANPMSMIAGRVALEHFTAEAIERLNSLGDQLRSGLTEAGIAVSGRGSLTRIREDVDLPRLWWALYGEGVLAGTNGLLALSTPMTDDHVHTVTTAVVTAVRGLRGGNQ